MAALFGEGAAARVAGLAVRRDRGRVGAPDAVTRASGIELGFAVITTPGMMWRTGSGCRLDGLPPKTPRRHGRRSRPGPELVGLVVGSGEHRQASAILLPAVTLAERRSPGGSAWLLGRRAVAAGALWASRVRRYARRADTAANSQYRTVISSAPRLSESIAGRASSRLESGRQRSGQPAHRDDAVAGRRYRASCSASPANWL